MEKNKEKFSLKKRLLDKSFEAYILALETINRLTIEYRLEAFCYLICNAWELLLKAKILEDIGAEDAIYYKQNKDKKEKGNPRRTLSLRDCLNQVIPNEQAPIRRNIERIEELRNESVHLVISQIPRDIMLLFQAGVLNYHSCLKKWFDKSLSDRVSAGMMSIVYDIAPEQWDITNSRLQQQLGPDSAEFLSKYCAKIKQERAELQHSNQFAIGMEYHLVLTKRHNDADIVLSSGPSDKDPTQIVEVPKDPSRTHPFRQKELLKEINKKITTERQINQYDIQCINKVYDMKKESKYFYQGKVEGSPGQYSRAFVDWIIKQYKRDEHFFDETRKKVKNRK